VADPVLLSRITSTEKAGQLLLNRRPSASISADRFYHGDHFQNFEGWIGEQPQPGTPEYNEGRSNIERGFVSENVIKEVVDRHRSGLLGREPLWGFLPSEVTSPATERRRKLFSKLFKLVNTVKTTVQSVTRTGQFKFADEADDALTLWWNNRNPREVLKQALTKVLLEDRAVLHFHFPLNLRDVNGEIAPQADLTSAANIPRVQVLSSDKAGVFIDVDSLQEFGVYSYQRTTDDKRVVELTFVQDGLTILRVLVDGQDPQDFTFELGGRLLMHELTRPALITPQVISNQKSLNLALTMMMRNVNLAGSLERIILNAQQPTQIKRIKDSSAPGGYREEEVKGNFWVGPGATTALNGVLIKDKNGEIVGRANPNISYRDPVSVETFTETRDQFYASILGQCQQRHALISGDAVASGRSRSEARGEYRTSLADSKDPVDDAGRWILETELRLAAQFCNRTGDFLALRADFNSIIEDGPVTVEEREANRADVQAGLLSKETAMSRNGVEDTQAELERIAQEPRPVIDLTKQEQGQGGRLAA